MGDLDAGRSALQADEARHALERAYVLVLPDAEVVRADPSARLNRGCFRNDKTRSSDGAAAQVDQVPVGGKAVLAGVLAHG